MGQATNLKTKVRKILDTTEGRVEIVLRSGHRLILGGAFDPDVVLRLVRGLAQA